MREATRRSCGVTDGRCIGNWYGVVCLEEEIDTLLEEHGRGEDEHVAFR